MEQQIDELSDLDVVDGELGLVRAVITKSCCFVPSLSFTFHADIAQTCSGENRVR